MTQQLTHWKKLTNPDYLGAYDFQPNEERILTIKDVRRQMVRGVDGKQDECTVAHFHERCKPMILNVTNSKTISILSESPYIEMWIGKRIKIYVAKIKVKGEFMDALRIRDEKLRPKPILQIGDSNFIACRKAYFENPANLEKVLFKYDVQQNVIDALIAPEPVEASNEAV